MSRKQKDEVYNIKMKGKRENNEKKVILVYLTSKVNTLYVYFLLLLS